MKKYILCNIMALAYSAFLMNSYSQEVIHSIPAPGLKCQDVAWDGTNLWTTDIVTRMYYKIDPEDGSILHSIPFPMNMPYSEGITFEGQYLWTCSWEETNGYGSKLFKVEPESGDVIDYFNYPGGIYDNWPHGITFDGTHLWANNYKTNTLDKIDPATGNLLTSLPAPGDNSIGIAWDGAYFWTNNYQMSRIYKQNTISGEILGEEYIPIVNMRGLTWDGEYLWCVSWETQTIYKIDVGPLYLSEKVLPEFSLFPNPSKGNINLHPGINMQLPMQIQLNDLQGKIIKEITYYDQEASPQNLEIDLKDLPDGLYVLRLISDREIWSEKIILKK